VNSVSYFIPAKNVGLLWVLAAVLFLTPGSGRPAGGQPKNLYECESCHVEFCPKPGKCGSCKCGCSASKPSPAPGAKKAVRAPIPDEEGIDDPIDTLWDLFTNLAMLLVPEAREAQLLEREEFRVANEMIQKLAARDAALAARESVLDAKIQAQLEKRGWSVEDVQTTVNKPHTTSLATNKATGADATAYFNEDGSYVVRDNATGQIIQVSNRNDPAWVPDPSIRTPFRPKP
jgi:hypothetical protein